MKEAIGTSMVFTLIMVFVGIFIVLFVSAISYSKVFKVRNRIIEIIEKHDGFNEAAKNEIDENLSAIGYRIVKKKCPDNNGVQGTQESDYYYCLYEYSTSRGQYYGVTVFIQFDIPLIGNFINIPVYGETRILYMKDRVEG